MHDSLVEIARRTCDKVDAVAKSVEYYAVYDHYFGNLCDEAITLLELGVHKGESLKVWTSYFRRGTIIGLDIMENGADFSGYPNIVFERGDQTDSKRLEEICVERAPNGLDIVIDDASHIGQNSLASYMTLFRYLKPGGLYVVEDWGTGYFDEWTDGGRLTKVRSEIIDGQIVRRIPSHDFGMVGFVKSLVDELAGDKVKISDISTRADIVSFIHFYKNIVIVKKA